MNQTKEYITEEEINKAKHELAYGCFYMKKLYEDIERIQNGQKPYCQESYYFDEKLHNFFSQVRKIGIENFISIIHGLKFDDLKDQHYTNIQ